MGTGGKSTGEEGVTEEGGGGFRLTPLNAPEIQYISYFASIKRKIELVESTTTVFELLSPLSGIVVAVNPEAESAPRKVMEDPYGEGWLLSIRPAAREELDSLLTAEEYDRFVGETLHQP